MTTWQARGRLARRAAWSTWQLLITPAMGRETRITPAQGRLTHRPVRRQEWAADRRVEEDDVTVPAGVGVAPLNGLHRQQQALAQSQRCTCFGHVQSRKTPVCAARRRHCPMALSQQQAGRVLVMPGIPETAAQRRPSRTMRLVLQACYYPFRGLCYPRPPSPARPAAQLTQPTVPQSKHSLGCCTARTLGGSGGSAVDSTPLPLCTTTR